jgi:hypothetical protein
LTKALRRVPQEAIYSAQARVRDLRKARSHAEPYGLMSSAKESTDI